MVRPTLVHRLVQEYVTLMLQLYFLARHIHFGHGYTGVHANNTYTHKLMCIVLLGLARQIMKASRHTVCCRTDFLNFLRKHYSEK